MVLGSIILFKKKTKNFNDWYTAAIAAEKVKEHANLGIRHKKALK